MGIIAASCGVLCTNVRATGILYQFDNVFSGSSSPAGPAPWVSATLQNTVNGVLLTVNNSGLSAGEFLSSLYLNINPADNVNNLIFTYQGSTSGVNNPTIQTGEDSFKADGDGKYDILFNFATDGGRFGAGDYVSYLISGISGLSAADFSFLSTPAGGSGPFYAAGHIQGIGGSSGNSVWVEPSAGSTPIPVPEPSSAALTVVAILLLGGTRFGLRRHRV